MMVAILWLRDSCNDNYNGAFIIRGISSLFHHNWRVKSKEDLKQVYSEDDVNMMTVMMIEFTFIVTSKVLMRYLYNIANRIPKAQPVRKWTFHFTSTVLLSFYQHLYQGKVMIYCHTSATLLISNPSIYLLFQQGKCLMLFWIL